MASIFTRMIDRVRGSKASSMMFPTGNSYFSLPNARFDFNANVDPLMSSVTAAVIGWLARNYLEAPLRIYHEEDGQEVIVPNHPLPLLVRKPTPYYSGAAMMMAVITDLIVNGNAYMIKVRDKSGRMEQLWWTPFDLITPKGNVSDPSVFIDRYEYKPGSETALYHPDDVVHLRMGLDPNNIRLGYSPLRAALREIWTDDEAANFSASLLRNMGIPGVILSPKDSMAVVTQDTIDETKEKWKSEFNGDNRGSLAVMTGPTDVKVLSFNPQQMDLSVLRGLPEERVTALLGVPAAVVGFGTGIAQTKVGATMNEMRELGYENGIIPIQRLVAEDLTNQLLPEYPQGDIDRADYDLTGVRVLQSDQTRVIDRLDTGIKGGWVKVSEGRRAINLPVSEDDEVYLRPLNYITTTGAPEGVFPSEPVLDLEEGEQVSDDDDDSDEEDAD